MPLRDHFRPPLSDIRRWDSLHGQWPAMIVQYLADRLPESYFAAPRVYLGTAVELDLATFAIDPRGAPCGGDPRNGEGGGVATAVWAPPAPSRVLVDLPDPDEYEVRVYDTREGRRLVAAIEIVSPANKDRPESRRAFVAKCAALIQARVSVTIIDLVTSRAANLYADLLEFLGDPAPLPTDDRRPPYAATCRPVDRKGEGRGRLLESWSHPLTLGQPLPTLPLWLAEDLALPLDLEPSYEQTCRVLRIP